MSALLEQLEIHSEGELENLRVSALGAWPLDTPGGRFYVEWDQNSLFRVNQALGGTSSNADFEARSHSI